ncbi:hypothetical protein BSF38_05045 [Paludisphaera borealis]|uniref:Uncharacterized protein n=2 Tax=Paludisphaera borealis TaxID=1387353 RepID=A0A1U7CX08_9BACT|nr:hypothetical protein BSF38_05045 [Paludisphaera borealis]
MEGREGPRGSRLNRAVAAGACALATALSLTATSTAQQSPFTQPLPRTSGSFSLPPPSGPRREATPPRPGESPTRSTSPIAPLRPIPGTGPLIVPDMTLPLPLPPASSSDAKSSHFDKLPPKPAVAPPMAAEPTGPISKVEPVVLKAGLTVTLRICQVLPADGFSAGERLLNSRPAIQEGDRFLAEVIDPCPPHPALVGGVVTRITGPGRFGRPGYVSMKMTQLVHTNQGKTEWIPWRMDMADRRFATRMRRVMLSTLLGLEGAGTGASVGVQYAGGNMAFIGGAMGIGAIVGMGYASFQRGTEANLEPGDTFEIVVGTTDYRPVSREWQTILYPAADPTGGKVKHK